MLSYLTCTDTSLVVNQILNIGFLDFQLLWKIEISLYSVHFSQADKGAHKMYKVLKAANKKVDEDEMLVEALTLIKTGSLPEKQDKEIPEKETSLAMAAKPAETSICSSLLIDFLNSMFCFFDVFL